MRECVGWASCVLNPTTSREGQMALGDMSITPHGPRCMAKIKWAGRVNQVAIKPGMVIKGVEWQLAIQATCLRPPLCESS